MSSQFSNFRKWIYNIFKSLVVLIQEPLETLNIPLPLTGPPFDPIYIVLQIITLQSLFYLLYVFVVVSLDGIFSIRPALSQILSSTAVIPDSLKGIVGFSAFIITCASSSLLFYYVIERSRLCLDFALTLLIIHILIITAITRRIPISILFYLCISCGLFIMTVLSEYACYRREVRDSLLISDTTETIDLPLEQDPTVPISISCDHSSCDITQL